MKEHGERATRRAWTGALILGTSLAGVIVACGSDDPATTTDTPDAAVTTGTDAATPPTTSDGGGGVTCASGETKCGSSCVDLQKNRENCGACGKACGASEVCASGKCALDCGAKLTKCDGASGATCVDTKSDPANCGACGTTCTAGTVCTVGAADAGDAGSGASCQLVCLGGTTKCGQKCSDTKTDDANCGACGAACAFGKVCTNGGCCDVGLTSCGNACVDTLRSNTNCGTCGTTCNGNNVCVAGTCQAPLGSCKAIKDAKPTARSGIYTIAINGTKANVYCDMTTDGGGWTMAAKFSRGIGGDAYTAWTGGALNDAKDELLDTKRSATDHYVSRIPTEWNTNFAVTQARVHMYKGADVGAFLRFADLAGTTNADWFAYAKLSKDGPASSWTDLNDLVTNNQAFPGNYFSAIGETNAPRRFYLSNNYGGCSVDNGWMTIDSPADPCTWETQTGPAPRILYGIGTRQTFQAGISAGTVEAGDTFVIFVR